jgi:hypothetical protein
MPVIVSMATGGKMQTELNGYSIHEERRKILNHA